MLGFDSTFSAITYIELQGFCLAIILYLLLATIKHNKENGHRTNAHLIALFISCMFIAIFDAVWAVIDASNPLTNSASYMANSLYFIAIAIAPFFWFIYQEEAAGTKLSKNYVLLVLIFLPCIVQIVFAVTAKSNHLLFYIAEDGSYHRGSHHIFSIILNFAYLLGATFRAAIRYMTSKDIFKKQLNMTLTYYPFAVIFFGVLQALTGYSFNCIGFTISLYLYYDNLLKGREKQQLKYENTLVEDYDAVFLIDSKNDSISDVRVGIDYNDTQERVDNESSYKLRILDGIRRNMSQEDKQRALVEFDAKNIMENLKTKKSYYYDYAINNIKNELVHYRAKFERAKDNYFILGIKNVEEEFKTKIELEKRKIEEARALSIIKNLSNDFESVYYIQINENKQDDVVTIYRNSPKLNEYIAGWEQEKSISKKYDLLIAQCIDENDREDFYKKTRREVILENLKTYPAYYVDFKAKIGPEENYYQVKYAIAAQDINGNIKSFITGLKNINKEVQIRNELVQLEEAFKQSEAFVKLFVDSYVSAYYINLVDGSYTIYKREGVVEDKFAVNTYYDSMLLYIDNFVLEEDREMLREACSIENIKKTLAEKDDFSVVFTDISEGNYFYKMQVIRGADKDHAALAFMDVNDEYLKEQAIQKQLEEEVAERTKELKMTNATISKMNVGIMILLGDMVESRDKESGAHVHRVKNYTSVLANQIMKDYPEYELTQDIVDDLVVASVLHDVGKIGIPDSILLKPGKLTADEYQVMKTHCDIGCELLKKLEDYWDPKYYYLCQDICHYHHERWDGSGYPCGLVGDETPISAQIVAVGDCFDALATKRVYKDAVEPEAAFNMILNGECGAFSPKVISSLIKCKDDFISFVK